jgi:hypothetical protein
MTKFKLLAVVTILSAVISTPGIAQQAVEESSLQTFYHSLGVGSSTSGVANASASLRKGLHASGPGRHLKPAVSSGADASYCRQRWAYYDPASGTAMGDDGEWRPCPP